MFDCSLRDDLFVREAVALQPHACIYSIFLDLDCTVLHFFDFSEICSTSLSNQINVFKILNNINPYVEKMLILTKMDLGWEKFMNQTKKAGLTFLQKKMLPWQSLNAK